MFKNYLKVTLRHLWNHKQVTLINMIGLSVGMAVCILMVLYIKDEISYDQFHTKKDQVYRIVGSYSQGGEERNQSAETTYLLSPLLESNFPGVEKVVRLDFRSGLFKLGEKVYEEDHVIAADSAFFDLFTYQPLVGNLSTALDAPNSVVLTEAMAIKYFGNNWQENAVGNQLLYEDIAVKVTAVIADMPEQAHFHGDFILSMATVEPFYPKWVLENSTGTSHFTYVLLSDGYSAEALDLDLNSFIQQNSNNKDSAPRYLLQSLPSIHLHSQLTGEIEPNGDIAYVYIFSAVALIILFLACVNYMNLATAKSMERMKEVGIRKATGASRKQLIGQFLGEAILTSIVSFLIAGLLVEIVRPLFNNLAQKEINLNITQNIPLYLGFASLAILVGLVAGGYPALIISRFDAVGILRGTTSKLGGKGKLRKTLVVFQFTISLALLMGTLIIYQQLTYLRNAKLGINPDQVITVPLLRLEIADQYEVIRNQLLQDSRIQSVTAANQPVTNRVGHWRGYQISGKEEEMYINTLVVDYDFFKTLQAKMLEGRDFSREFPTDGNEAYILNEAAVKLIGLEKPIGTPIVGATFTGAEWSKKDAKIIGVVEDFHFASLHSEIQPVIFSLHTEKTTPITILLIKVDGKDLAPALAHLDETWKKFAGDRPLQYSFMDDAIANMYLAENRFLNVFTAFSTIAILIACLGIFGLASYMATQRTKEIGIRKVLGASVTSIVAMLSYDFTILVGIAFFIAVPIAIYTMHEWLQSFAYKIEIGVGIFLMAGGSALLIAWLTVSYQSVKAALANPVNSLKVD